MALREEVVFCATSAYFPEEQWMLLKEWQKELYGNVMKEIHRALMSLGPLIATTVYTLRDKEKQDVSPAVPQQRERRRSFNDQGDATANSHQLSSLKRDGVSHLDNPDETKGAERMDCLNTGHPSVSFCVKDEDAAYCVYDPEIPSTQVCSIPTIFTSVKPEQDAPFQQLPSSEGTAAGGEEKITFEGLSRRVKSLESKESLTNREKQMWPGNILVLGEQETIDHENACVYPEQFKLQEGTSNTQISDKSNNSGSQPWNSNLAAYHTSAQINSRPFACTECKNFFKTEVEFTRHQRTHLGARPFRCTICDMSFIQNQHLIQHQRSHTGERPYQCPKCKQRFSLKGNLNKHLRKQTSRCRSP